MEVVDELDHKKVYPGVPPEPVAVALPLVPPLQLGFVPEDDTVSIVGLESVTEPEEVQLLASVVVTVKVPAVNPLMV